MSTNMSLTNQLKKKRVRPRDDDDEKGNDDEIKKRSLLDQYAEMLVQKQNAEPLDALEVIKEEEKKITDKIQNHKTTIQSAQERSKGIIYKDSMPSTWTPPSYLKDLPEADKEKIREKFNVVVDGENVPPPILRFKDFKFPKTILSVLKKKGIKKPTPIQMQAIPCLLSGRDVIGIAYTGSGKTLVFVLPAICQAYEEEAKTPLTPGEGPFALILCPSRELARQTYEVAVEFCNAMPPPPRGALGFMSVFSSSPSPSSRDRDTSSSPSSSSSSSSSSCARRTSCSPSPSPGSAVYKTETAPSHRRAPTPTSSSTSTSPSAASGTAAENGPLMSSSNAVVRVYLCIGGIDDNPQKEVLRRGAHIVVATPGKLKQMLSTGKLSLDFCKLCCLDEADRMFDTNFEEEVRDIFNFFKRQRQIVLFSATMPKNVQEFAQKSLVKPITISTSSAGAANLDVIQEVELVKQEAKNVYLLECLQKTAPPVLVFCENKADVDSVHEYLLNKGVLVCSVHGGMAQADREESVRLFKAEKKDVLIATDVASKGLDFPDIQHVINYDMPREMENYIHRIGRTGRNNRTGVATTFINHTCSDSILLDLKHQLIQAHQAVPPVLLAVNDPFANLYQTPAAASLDGAKGCRYCGGLGHRIADCPKYMQKIKDKLKPAHSEDRPGEY